MKVPLLFLAVTVFLALYAYRVEAFYQATCSGRVVTHSEATTESVAVWRKRLEALSVVSAVKVDVMRIRSLNETIVDGMRNAFQGLSSLSSTVSAELKDALTSLLEGGKALYESLKASDIDSIGHEIHQAEAKVTSIKGHAMKDFCEAENVLATGAELQKKLTPLRDEYEEAYGKLMLIFKTVNNHDALGILKNPRV